jgi:hypothetical protein
MLTTIAVLACLFFACLGFFVVALVKLVRLAEDIASTVREIRSHADQSSSHLYDMRSHTRRCERTLRKVHSLQFEESSRSFDDTSEQSDIDKDKINYDDRSFFEEEELPDNAIFLPKPYDRYAVDLQGRIFSCASAKYEKYKRIVSQQVAIYPRPNYKEDGHQTFQMRRERLFFELLVDDVPDMLVVEEPDRGFDGDYVSNLSLRIREQKWVRDSRHFRTNVPDWVRREMKKKASKTFESPLIKAEDWCE